jgi:hypothetical protein
MSIHRFQVTTATHFVGRETYVVVMGLLSWISNAVGRDLDRHVSGAEGTAQGRHDSLADDEPLTVRARLGEGQRGTLVLRAPPREERGEGTLSVDLGPGRDLRGGAVAIEAHVTGGAQGLAALVVELSQPRGGDTYSVEARPDQNGRAHLRLSVQLG